MTDPAEGADIPTSSTPAPTSSTPAPGAEVSPTPPADLAPRPSASPEAAPAAAPIGQPAPGAAGFGATAAGAPIDPVEHPALARPRRSATVGLVAALAVGALVGGVSGAGVTLWATSQNAGTPVVGATTPTTITVNDSADATRITAVASKAMPSVVTIQVTAGDSGGTGSGVVLSADGYVLTNAHVVTLDGAASNATLSVQTSDGRLFSATVVGVDPIVDLAVIKVDGVSDLTPATFADSGALNVGDSAVAIGAPLGLAGTVTDGIVSALNRSITIASSAVPDDASSDSTPTPNDPNNFWNFDLPGRNTTSTGSSATISLSVIQTDAAINPGNSGGALLNSDGEVIGINVAIASAGSSSGQSGSIGVGFAIPSNLAQRVAKELIQSGSATHGLLGASVADVQEDTAQSNPTVVGASIVSVVAGGAAASAGLKAGDIITGFNGVPITGKTDLTAQVRALAAGSTASITYVRGGSANEVQVTLGTYQG